MPNARLTLLVGDLYRCERALVARQKEIITREPTTERHTLFADEIDLASLRIELQSTSLFALSRHFVIRHAEALKEPKQFAILLNQGPSPETVLTLVAETMSASSPVYKAIKAHGEVIRFPQWKGKALESAVSELLTEQGIATVPGLVSKLISNSGKNLFFISQEAKKLHSFCAKDDMDMAQMDRLLSAVEEGSIYPMLDRVGEAKLRESLLEFTKLHQEPGRVLSALLRHLTRLLSIRVLLDESLSLSKIGEITGEPHWLLGRLVNQAKRRSTKKLTAVLNRGIELDAQIKSGSIRAADGVLALIFAATASELPLQGYIQQNQPSLATNG